jgi:hypothetical protein
MANDTFQDFCQAGGHALLHVSDLESRIFFVSVEGFWVFQQVTKSIPEKLHTSGKSKYFLSELSSLGYLCTYSLFMK